LGALLYNHLTDYREGYYSINCVRQIPFEVNSMSLTSEELREAMFRTRLEVFELMYQLRIATDPLERKSIKIRIKTLQRLHYWQIRQLQHLEEQECPLNK